MLPRLSVEFRNLPLDSDELQFGASYAQTLKEWHHRFLGSWARISRLGFDEPFRRLWKYYLCYCEAGFRAAATDVRLLKLIERKLAPSLGISPSRPQHLQQ